MGHMQDLFKYRLKQERDMATIEAFGVGYDQFLEKIEVMLACFDLDYPVEVADKGTTAKLAYAVNQPLMEDSVI